MRVHDTRTIIDSHQPDIEDRFRDWSYNPDSLMFLRLYHLPPYFEVPLTVKSKLAAYVKPNLEALIFAGRPKETLMALELGCVVCGRRPELKDNLWTAKLEEGWRDGVCPDCMVPPYCGQCGAPATRPWNLCDDCWQDVHRRFDVRSLAARYGACSALLVRPPSEVVRLVPTTRRYRLHGVESVVELLPKAPPRVRVTRLDQLDINIEEVLKKHAKYDTVQAREGQKEDVGPEAGL